MKWEKYEHFGRPSGRCGDWSIHYREEDHCFLLYNDNLHYPKLVEGKTEFEAFEHFLEGINDEAEYFDKARKEILEHLTSMKKCKESRYKQMSASDVLPKVRVQFRAGRRYVMEMTEDGQYRIIATLHAPEYAALFGAAQRMHDSLKDCIETMEYVLDDITTTEASKEMLRDSLKQAKVALKISEQ